jgi:hypothetical protein
MKHNLLTRDGQDIKNALRIITKRMTRGGQGESDNPLKKIARLASQLRSKQWSEKTQNRYHTTCCHWVSPLVHIPDKTCTNALIGSGVKIFTDPAPVTKPAGQGM